MGNGVTIPESESTAISAAGTPAEAKVGGDPDGSSSGRAVMGFLLESGGHK